MAASTLNLRNSNFVDSCLEIDNIRTNTNVDSQAISKEEGMHNMQAECRKGRLNKVAKTRKSKIIGRRMMRKSQNNLGRGRK